MAVRKSNHVVMILYIRADRLPTPILSKIFCTCFLTVISLMNNLWAISTFLNPLQTFEAISNSLSVRKCSGINLFNFSLKRLVPVSSSSLIDIMNSLLPVDSILPCTNEEYKEYIFERLFFKTLDLGKRGIFDSSVIISRLSNSFASEIQSSSTMEESGIV